MKKRLTIGVITVECYSKYETELYKGIISQAFKASCNVIFITSLHRYLYPSTEHTFQEKKIYDIILADKFDGFIYDREAFYHDEVITYIDKLCEKSKKPVLVLGTNKNKFFENIYLDEHDAFEKITDHMIEKHGYKKIYCLTGPKENIASAERLNGYMSSMKKHGLHFDDSYYFYGDFFKDAAVELAHKITEKKISRPDAIVCANDHSAAFLCSELIHKGIRVPEDIAITGYDGFEKNLCREVEITTYRRENFRYGAEAFRHIYRTLTGNICSHIPNKRNNLIIGNSCGCTDISKPDSAQRHSMTVSETLETKHLYSDMPIEVCDSESLEELMLNIGMHAYLINKVNNILICLSEDFEKILKEDTQRELTLNNSTNMKIFLNRSYNKIKESTKTTFKLNDILPDEFINQKFPVAYYLTPLHFNKNHFGYAALSFGKRPESFEKLYLHWIRYVNISLHKLMETTILKNMINKLSSPEQKTIRQNPHIKKLEILRQKMINNPEYEWKIEDIASDLFLSRSYLQKLYKDCFDKGIIEDLIDFRVEKASDMLINTDKTINDIALECGYTSYSYFSKQFKTIKNISPAEYRKNNSKKISAP